MKKLPIFFAILALCLSMTARSDAQLITSVGSPFTVSTGTAGPGDASDYDYLTFTDDPYGPFTGTPATYLTNFTVNQVAANYRPTDSSYAFATAPGGSSSFETGTEYITPGSSNLLTFQVNNSAETAFNVYILTDNSSNNDVNGSKITLSSSGLGSTPATIEATDVVGVVDEYLEFSVTDATTSDVFTISGAPGYNAGTGVGGITFENETPSVPEPNTYALLGLGLGVVAVLARRKKLVIR